MKKILIAIAAIGLLVIICSKAYINQNNTTVNAEHIDAQRSGRVAEDGEYAYFGDPDNGYALSKLDLSFGEITTVVDKQSYAT